MPLKNEKIEDKMPEKVKKKLRKKFTKLEKIPRMMSVSQRSGRGQ